MTVGNLILAITSKVLDDVKKFLKHVNEKTAAGLGPIHFLSNYDLNDLTSKEIFDLIVNGTSNINVQSTIEGKTLLHFTNFDAITKELIKRNANINLQDNAGNTPLMSHVDVLTCRFLTRTDYTERINICKTLLESGADVNIYNHEGDLPLFKMLSLRSATDILTLINFPQFNMNAEDKWGNTVLDLAIQPQLIRTLLTNYEFEPLFLMSALKVHDETIRQLVYAKWDQVNCYDFVKELVRYSDSFKNNAVIIYAVWRYLIQQRYPVTRRMYASFFHYVSNRILLEFDLFSFREYDKYVCMYLEYNNFISLADLQTIYGRYNDNKLINKIAIYAYYVQLPKLLFEFEPFLYILLNPRCHIRDALMEFYPALDRCVKNIQNIARYCTLPYHLYQFYRDHCDDDCVEIARTMGRIRRSVPTLLELSRNAVRYHFGEKYKISHPRKFDYILNTIQIPKSIQEIIKLERPINYDIPRPRP